MSQSGSRQKILSSLLNVDLHDNGLKFERDTKFKITLKIKAIITMTVLLVIAAVVCVGISKILKNKTETAYKETTTTFLHRVPYDYDPDSLESIKEREILRDVKTKFLPHFVQYHQPRMKRDTGHDEVGLSTQDDALNSFTIKFNDSSNLVNFSSPITDNKSKDESEKAENEEYSEVEMEIRWTKVVNKKLIYQRENVTNGIVKDVHINRVNIRPNDEVVVDGNDTPTENEDFILFWNDTGDEQTIRNTQARMMKSYMDTTVNPCVDFYQYACGNWGKKNPIPKDKAGFDTFEMLRESLDTVLRDLLIEPGDNVTTSARNKVKNYYKSCMNEDILEKRQNIPLVSLIENLGGWPMIDPQWNESSFDWIVMMAKLRLHNNDVLLSQWVGADIKNSSEYVIQFDQTSLGLPTRDYFLQTSNSIYLEAYKNYMIRIATLLGANETNATSDADDLIRFETELAQITQSIEERRNVTELYHRMTLSELTSSIPQIEWNKYLNIVLGKPFEESDYVVIFALKYVKDLVILLEKTKPRTLSNYLLWRFIRHRVNNLDKKFQEAKQNFYYILFGREKAPPRWKYCVSQTNLNMGMGLGSLFVKRYFDQNSKNDTLEMTMDIMKAFRDLLKGTEWLDQDTRRLAEEKVNATILRIGYPDFILDEKSLDERYQTVEIHPDLYFENTLNILQHLTKLEQDRLGSPVNKTLWNTPPAVVNAYYSRNKNQIMFPAGILQPPFYHRHYPRALNYGGIGVVIGHEITHGFDDKGRLFDQDGNLNNWWKYEAVMAFHKRAQCLVDQYGAYSVTEVNMNINGVNTQGENIADNGGIKQAFKAYQNWLSTHGSENETLPGINANNLQLFFLNFAQVWCGTMRPEAMRNKLKTAVHPPGRYRVIGTLSNSEEFAQVFNCPPGSPMNPVFKCSVW